MKEKETDEALFVRIHYMMSWFHFNVPPDELYDEQLEILIARSNEVRDLIFNRIDRETT